MAYELTVWEVPAMWQASPDIIMQSFAPIAPPQRTPANVNTLNWNNAITPLEPGTNYLYRVQAIDPTGRLRFRNNGFSPHQFFSYAGTPGQDDIVCLQPENLLVVNGDELRWAGEDLTDVPYTVTITDNTTGSFISRSSVQAGANLSRLLTGAGRADYTYDLPTYLDGDARAYRVELCAYCPATGEDNCVTTVYGTAPVGPGGTPEGPDDEVDVTMSDDFGTVPDDDGDSNCGVYGTRSFRSTETTATTATFDYQFERARQFTTTLTLTAADGQTITRPIPNQGRATVTDLMANTTYTAKACATCGQTTLCDSVIVSTTDYDCPTPADLLSQVVVEARPLDAVYVDWSRVRGEFRPGGWSARVNDGQPVTGTPNSDGNDGNNEVISGLRTDTTYQIQVCYECTNGAKVCADFEAIIPSCGNIELDPEIVGVGFDSIHLSWLDMEADEYTASIYPQDNPDNVTRLTVDTNEIIIRDRRPLTSYVVEICSPCGPDAEVCDEITVTTPKVECAEAGDNPYEFDCELDGSVDEIESRNLITDLSVGDSIWAGDFLIEVGHVEGNGPSFGGYGFAKVPYLKNAKVKVDFFEIEVNENCRMVGGEMVVGSVGQVIQSLSDQINSVVSVLNDIDNFLTNLQQTLGQVSQVLNQLADNIDRWDEIAAVADAAVAGVQAIPFIPQDLVNQVQSAADCMKDKAGSPLAANAQREMDACAQEMATAMAAVQAYVDKLVDAPFQVQFENTSQRPYGWDVQQYTEIAEEYTMHTINGEEYRVPWASTATTAGRPGDAFRATRVGGGELTDVRIIGSDGEVISGWEVDGDVATTNSFSALGDQQVIHAFAAVPGDTTGGMPPVRLAGHLSVVTYDPVDVTVNIVPVNGVELPSTASLQQDIADIFDPAVVNVTVNIRPNLDATETFDGTLSDVGNNTLSNYTPEMLDLRRLVKQQSYHDGEEYYLLVVPNMEPAGRDGFMPRKRRFGFLNRALIDDAETLARVAAHELAHGAFRLQHTFDRFTVQPGVTDNLLDYNGGERLYRYQWGNVHDPEGNFTLFDDREEGESVDITLWRPSREDQFAKVLSDLSCATFNTYTGYPDDAQTIMVTIPSTLPFRNAQQNRPAQVLTWSQGGITISSSSRRELQLSLYARPPDKISLGNDRWALKFEGPNGEYIQFRFNSENDCDTAFEWFDGGHLQLYQYEAQRLSGLDSSIPLSSALYRTSTCAMEAISGSERFRYISILLNDNPGSIQKNFVGDLMNLVSDDLAYLQQDVAERIRDYRSYNLMFSELRDDPNAYRKVLSSFMSAFWTLNPENKPSLLGGHGGAESTVLKTLRLIDGTTDTPYSISSSNVSVSQNSAGDLNFTRSWSTTNMVAGVGFPSGDGWNSNSTSHVFSGQAMTPVLLYVGRGHSSLGFASGSFAGVVPTNFAAALAYKRTAEIEDQARSIAFDLALLSLGVGEIGAVIAAWNRTRTALSLLRLTIAVADLAAANMDIHCQGSDQSLCQEWQQVSVYVNLGLLSVSVADGLAALNRRTIRASDSYAGFLNQVDNLLSEASARAAFRSEWALNTPGFRTFFAGADDTNLPNRLKAWQYARDAFPTRPWCFN